MKTVEEIIKESVDEINKDYEYNAKGEIKKLLNDIIRQQEIIAAANGFIKRIQEALKSIEVKQVPSNFLI